MSYIDLIYYNTNNTWDEYIKLGSIIDILQTYNHSAVQQIIYLQHLKLQKWFVLYNKLDILTSRPHHYMKYIFLTHEVNDIWS